MSNKETNTCSSSQQGAEDLPVCVSMCMCVCVSLRVSVFPRKPVVIEEVPVREHVCLACCASVRVIIWGLWHTFTLICLYTDDTKVYILSCVLVDTLNYDFFFYTQT